MSPFRTTVEDCPDDVPTPGSSQMLPSDSPIILEEVSQEGQTDVSSSDDLTADRLTCDCNSTSVHQHTHDAHPDVTLHAQATLRFASTLEEYYLSNDQILHDFALAHKISFLDGAIGTLVDSILHHLLHGKCFSSAWPGPACICSRSSFIDMRDLVSKICTVILDKAVDVNYLKSVCNILGMTQMELENVENIQDCKRYIQMWQTDFIDCENVEDILIQCDDLRPSELLVTCRKHNIPTDVKNKVNLDIMRNRLVSHLCKFESAANADSPSVPTCCSRSAKEKSQLIDKVLVDLCERTNVKKNLKRILNSLGVAVTKSDNVARVRQLAREYLKKAKKFPAAPKTNRMARLRDATTSQKRKALEEIRKTWPRKLGSQTKAKLVNKFRYRTSAKVIRRLPCAVCAEGKTAGQLVEKPISLSDIDLDVLRRPYPPQMKNPFEHNTSLNQYILCPEGVVDADSDNPSFRICRSCLNSLQGSDKMPSLALANDLLVGTVPDCLKDLTLVEESMIALRRGKCCMIHLNGDSNLLASPISQRGLRGHVIIYPTKIHCMANVLPPPMDDIVTPMCVVFVGSAQPTKEWLLKSAKPLVVRREKVRKALMWLKDNNPLYKDICINHELLNTYEHTFVAPVHITVREPEDDINAQGSNTAHSQSVPELPDGVELAFDSAVITDLEGRVVTPSQMQIEALRHLKSGGGFVQIPHGSEPTNTYSDHDAFPALFPTLFPYGVYGFETEERPRKISMKVHNKHLLSLADSRFQEHATFQFMVFNTLQKRDVNSSVRFKINKDQFQFFKRGLDGISLQAIDSICNRLENGGLLQPQNEEERVITQLMNKVTAINGNVEGTSSSRVRTRNKIRAMMHYLGMPSFYITINPADVYSPILKFMSGEDIDVDNLLPEQVPQYWEQATRIARNPVLSAQFFDLSMQEFFNSILNYTPDHDPEQLGVLGLTKGYFGCIEAQGRGTLHCHLFVWLEGALDPQQIKDRVTDKKFTEDLCDYIDDTIKSAVPSLPTVEKIYPLQEYHPCSIRGPPIDNELTFFDSIAAKTDIHLLAKSCQRHVHAATCYKYWKGLHEKKECRFNLDPDVHVEKTTLDPETGEFEFRVSDGMVNNFCDTILMAMRCNIDIKFIGSGQSAKAVLYYITDYITKSQLKAHTSYAALKTAVIKLRAQDQAEDCNGFEYKARQLLVKCANSLISKQELSAPQVSAYLMGFGDHYTSHTFRTLYLFAFEAYIKDHLPQRLQSQQNTNVSNEHLNDPEIADDESEEGNDDTDEQDPEHTYDDVFIAPTVNGNVKPVQNDVTDYLHRSHSDDDLPLWNFISQYEKLHKNRVKSKVVTNDEPAARGRPCNHRSGFLPSHPDFETHILRERCADNYYIPVLTSAVPNSEVDANKEKHALMMLILFKPWRSPDDLLERHDTWLSAYQSFLTTIDPEKLRVIVNMQLLNQCKNARDKDFEAKGAKRRNLLRSLDSSRGDRQAIDSGLDTFLGEDDAMVNRLNDMKRSKDKALNKERNDELSAIAAATDAGLYHTSEESPMDVDEEDTSNYIDQVHRLVTDNGKLETVWKDSYAQRRADYKKSLKRTSDSCSIDSQDNLTVNYIDTQHADLHMSITSLNNVQDRAPTRDTHSTHEAPSLTLQEKNRIMDEVNNEFTLNEEQERAYRSVANHAVQNKPCCPLSLFISGPGGTGKSRVIDALTTFFQRINETRRLRLASYTGVAAKNIKGMTLHTLLSLNQLFPKNEKANTTATEAELFESWSGVEYLFIDEVSMVGCELMTQISSALSIAKCNPDPFGGVSMIFAGDFCQLPPVKNTRLFSRVEKKTLPSSSQNRWAQMKLMGRSAWLATDTVVVLHQQMRQQGERNIRFRQLLDRLRYGRCNEDDINLLRTRLLANTDEDLTRKEWRSAPIITKHNHIKDALNVSAAEAYAARNFKPIHYYHAQDFRARRPVAPELQDELLTYNSGKTSQAMGRLPLVEGMPVMFCQNYDVSGGVVNGSIGILKSVRYTEDENGTRFAHSCVVELPDITCEPMEGLNRNEVVALAEEFDFKITDWRTNESATFKRKQLPIQPAFAMTDFKSQGRTLNRVIVDLKSCAGSQSPYVMISRATSLDGLLILRDFAPERLRCNLSEDLRDELRRIDSLHEACKARFATGQHFCRSSPDHPINSDLLRQIAPKELRKTTTSFQRSNPESSITFELASPTAGRESFPPRSSSSLHSVTSLRPSGGDSRAIHQISADAARPSVQTPHNLGASSTIPSPSDTSDGSSLVYEHHLANPPPVSPQSRQTLNPGSQPSMSPNVIPFHGGTRIGSSFQTTFPLSRSSFATSTFRTGFQNAPDRSSFASLGLVSVQTAQPISTSRPVRIQTKDGSETSPPLFHSFRIPLSTSSTLDRPMSTLQATVNPSYSPNTVAGPSVQAAEPSRSTFNLSRTPPRLLIDCSPTPNPLIPPQSYENTNFIEDGRKRRRLE